MTSNVKVTKDGYVHIGGNEWVSLAEIQEAVLRAQHPTLRSVSTGEMTAMNKSCGCVYHNCKEEHLPLPTMTGNKQTVNDYYDDGGDEHLPLPSTFVRRQETRKGQPRQNTNEDANVLPLPSTFWKTK